jgi:integrase
MQEAGATTALLPLTMMVVRRQPLHPVQKVRKLHLKFVSISPATTRRYKIAVHRFFVWRKSAGHSAVSSLAQLDQLGGEYLNFLWQDDSPLYWAGDFVSGLKRLYPACKRHLDTTKLYYDNWVKVTPRRRAFPFTLDLIRGVAALALIDGQPRLAGAFLVCFAGLLRVAEVMHLKQEDVKFLNPRVVVLLLPESKGAKRKGQTESVMIRDPTLVKILAFCVKTCGSDGLVFGGTYRAFAKALIEFAAVFGLKHPNLTPHGLRRGGATWHFGRFLSYDKTQAHGRWAQARTAKLYIDEAMAESGIASIPLDGQAKLAEANSIIAVLISQHFS